jgi:hypothetical protein
VQWRVFRRLIGKGQLGGSLNPGSIAPIFKRVARWIGMPGRFVDQVSGHSTRVGATRDPAALDIDLRAITQAGVVEVDTHAVAVCGEDQCGEIGEWRVRRRPLAATKTIGVSS